MTSSCDTAARGYLRHVVFFSAKDAADLDRIEAGLRLLSSIPHVRHFEVCRNRKADGIGNAVDIVVYAEFADHAALDAYHAHPLYAQSIAAVRPLRDMRVAADF